MRARPVSRLCAVLVPALVVAACDAGGRDDVNTHGPPVRLVASNVGPDRSMPEDGVVQLAFDRYLLPITVNRQSIVIVDAENQPLPSALAPTVTYDPVARTVTLGPPSHPWLQRGLVYKVALGLPQGDADVGGLRAIDRATLDPNQERIFAFRVGDPIGAAAERTADLCRDVLPVFVAKCSQATCHGEGGEAAAGLVLTNSAALAEGTLGKLAHGSSRGASTAAVSAPGRLFGEDMPLVDPGNPGNSWLLYKTEIAAAPHEPRTGPGVACPLAEGTSPLAPYVPIAPSHAPSWLAEDDERARLANFIAGPPMPYPVLESRSYSDQALTFDERERLRLWIASLPPTARALPDCGVCR